MSLFRTIVIAVLFLQSLMVFAALPQHAASLPKDWSAVSSTGTVTLSLLDTVKVIDGVHYPQSAAGIQMALDECPVTGCTLIVPPSSFALESTVYITKPVQISCSGRSSTSIGYLPESGAAFDIRGLNGKIPFGISGCSLYTYTATSSTAIVLASVEPVLITQMNISGFVGGVRVTGNGVDNFSVTVQISDDRIENIHGKDGYAISLDHVADVFINGLESYSTIDNATISHIIVDRGAQGIWLNSSNLIGGMHNLVVRYTDQGGAYGIVPSAIFATATIFDASTGGDSILFDSSLGTNAMRASFLNCWSAYAGRDNSGRIVTPSAVGLNIQGGSDIQWEGGVIRSNAYHGVQIGGNVANTLIQVIGAKIYANNQSDNAAGNGISIPSTTVTRVTVMNNSIGNVVDTGGHQHFGIGMVEGASKTNILAFNEASGNEDGAVSYGPTGTGIDFTGSTLSINALAIRLNGPIDGRGTGLKHVSAPASCAISGERGSTCVTDPIPWPGDPFPDTDYTVSCTLTGPFTNVPFLVGVTKAPASIVVTVGSLSGAATFKGVDCSAMRQ